jgi:hypothetical protein
MSSSLSIILLRLEGSQKRTVLHSLLASMKRGTSGDEFVSSSSDASYVVPNEKSNVG